MSSSNSTQLLRRPKQFSSPLLTETRTTELFLDRVINGTDCSKHKATHGMACYYLTPSTDAFPTFYAGICGSRAKKFGYTGKISSKSLRAHSSKH